MTTAPQTQDLTPGRRIYNRQVEFLTKQDVNALVENQYRPDAVLVGFDFVVEGHPALKEHFKQYLARLGSLNVLSTNNFVETEDSIFFEATVKVAGGVARVFDVFTLEEGQISRHFTGLLSFTPEEPQ
jgi:hypothetical protein